MIKLHKCPSVMERWMSCDVLTLYNNENECTATTSNSVGESHKHNIEWKEPDQMNRYRVVPFTWSAKNRRKMLYSVWSQNGGYLEE